MASVSALGTETFSTTNGSKSVTATPAVGDLIVIFTAHSGNTATVAPTDDNSSGTYTQIGSSVVKNSSADTMQVWVRDSLIGSATSTVFTHAPGSTTGGGLFVVKVTGMTKTGSAAARQFGKQDNQTASSTPAPAFSGSALTTNPVITAAFNASSPSGLTDPASYTLLDAQSYLTPTTGFRSSYVNSGETGSTITWGGTSATDYGSLVVELDSSSGGSVAPIVAYYQSMQD